MDHKDEMARLGFIYDGTYFVRGEFSVRRGYGSKRPWYAMKGTRTSLCSNGDMINSGVLRKFATPMAAANAAMEKWL
jgi:hypothetical protein